ncbi:hypothetical protein JCM10212_003235 [Sporobolomyces blumeae]
MRVTPHEPHYALLPSLSTFFAQFHPLVESASARSTWIDSAKRYTVSLDHSKRYYLDPSTDPLHPALWFCGAVSIAVWILGELTGNVSQVDRLWTTLPLAYSFHFTFIPYLNGTVSHVSDLDHRMLLVFALQCCWSARLTYQSARRGFLDPRSEDYRWPLVRQKIPTWAFKVLNFVFIAWIQNILLLVAELPQYLLLTYSLSTSSHLSQLRKLTPLHDKMTKVDLNVADVVLASLFLFVLVLEMRADNQQQAFQNLKHGALKKDPSTRSDKERKAIERGFVTGGLWGWSRHPNFACEQTTWWILYSFTVLPFLPVSESITSQPLSTFAQLVSPSTTRQFLSSVLDGLPSTTQLLTVAQHPVAYLKTLDVAHLNSATTRVWNEVKLATTFAIDELERDQGKYWNYSILGPVSMSALFFASTDLTERITGSKYPLYSKYQSRVSKFFPVFTPFKATWLLVTGRKAVYDKQLFGTGERVGPVKGLVGSGKGKEKSL